MAILVEGDGDLALSRCSPRQNGGSSLSRWLSSTLDSSELSIGVLLDETAISLSRWLSETKTVRRLLLKKIKRDITEALCWIDQEAWMITQPVSLSDKTATIVAKGICQLVTRLWLEVINA
ncbi:hypothetical protein Bca4012_062302 [Brassica carinata]|uniref:Uncharacterized protein n=1 Tax=Brassica carinata TaxID=52824 RepID=A0A8X7SAM6_BRACI|nr:hypothetical protein Bca52824_032210 [Brassica carinata]